MQFICLIKSTENDTIPYTNFCLTWNQFWYKCFVFVFVFVKKRSNITCWFSFLWWCSLKSFHQFLLLFLVYSWYSMIDNHLFCQIICCLQEKSHLCHGPWKCVKHILPWNSHQSFKLHRFKGHSCIRGFSCPTILFLFYLLRFLFNWFLLFCHKKVSGFSFSGVFFMYSLLHSLWVYKETYCFKKCRFLTISRNIGFW